MNNIFALLVVHYLKKMLQLYITCQSKHFRCYSVVIYIYFHVNINLFLVARGRLCVFVFLSVLYILHCDILYTAHLGPFPACYIGQSYVRLAFCVFYFQYHSSELSSKLN